MIIFSVDERQAAFPFAISVGYLPLQQAEQVVDASRPMLASMPSSER